MTRATRILIVEDEDSLRETLARFLAREGYDVLAASNGADAFDEAISASPDVLVADWMLKNHMHGLHVSEAMKAVNPDLHTILITGFPSRDLLLESDRCGVLQLLEKPFDLQALEDAIRRAEQTPADSVRRSEPVAVFEIDAAGRIEFANRCARNLLSKGCGVGELESLQDVFGAEIMTRFDASEFESDWVALSPLAAPGETWLLRARPRARAAGGWLGVICPEAERTRTADPRVRILLDHRSRPSPMLPDHGPVVVVERDGAVRRLLVSQVERIGALCYPTDDLAAALKLLRTEPRVRTVLLDFALAGDAMAQWVEAVKGARPEARVIGTGGAGSEDDLLALGVTSVLSKPWRIVDLLDVLSE